LLERLNLDGREVVAIGKIADIYAHKGPTKVIKANGNEALAQATIKAMDEAPDGALVMTNFVDFDMLFGHRRDVAGYADALEKFDRMIPEFVARLKTDDIMILTADHGCDPTWQGTDHTREQVPVLIFGKDLGTGTGGTRPTFADIGETAAMWLDIEAGETGCSILETEDDQ
jgi:phosphopentomutase